MAIDWSNKLNGFGTIKPASDRKTYTKDDLLLEFAENNRFRIRNRCGYPEMKIGIAWYRATSVAIMPKGDEDHIGVSIEICDFEGR